MVTKRGYLTKLLLVLAVACVGTTISSTAEAGPLLDWLFQRNRSQGLNGSGGCFGNSCLFGNQGRGYAASRFNNPNANPAANAYAGSPNPAATTAGYAPQGGCGAGWCQETVVRYVPQVAYRTMYQPVPVTTYKTSTSINPNTGLPRTCTRPCTSYSYQARRVPYTTYRPVYTTVPVADTWGQQPVTAGYAPRPNYTPTYAYQPPANSGCVGCQNSASSYAAYPPQSNGFSDWSRVPGYTPGNAPLLPAIPGSMAGSSSRSMTGPPAGGMGYGYEDSPRATPWRTVDDGRGYSASEWRRESSSDRGVVSESYSDGRGGYSATPWTSDPNVQVPADVRPRLNNRPIYPDEFGVSPLRPVPMSEEMRRRLNDQLDRSETSSSRRLGNEDFAYSRRESMFRTPNQQGYAPSPRFQEPANRMDAAAPSYDEYYRGGIRQRAPQADDFISPRDKTARSELKVRGEMPLIEETSHTRYASAPIRWPKQSRSLRNVADGEYQRNRVQSSWRPSR